MSPAAEAQAADPAATDTDAEALKRTVRRTTRRRTTTSAPAAAGPEPSAAGGTGGEQPADAVGRVIREAVELAEAHYEQMQSGQEEPEQEEPAPKRTVRRTTRARTTAAEKSGAVIVDGLTPQEAVSEEAASEDVASEEAPAAGTEPAVPPASKRRPARRLKAAEAESPSEEAGATAAAAEDTVQEAPAPVTAEADSAEAGGETPTEEKPAGKQEFVQSLNPFAIPESPVSLLFHAPDLSAVQAAVPSAKPAEEEAEEEAEGARGRRNRRGRGGRRGEAGTEAVAAIEEPEGSPDEQEAAEEGVTSRRRRRRRRGDQDLELTGGHDDDPPNTVTRVRAPRQHAEAPASSRVAGVKGSTRLEAKKQRRRESRESGRRRQVITEAEFLARRESVDRQMVVRQRADRIQIGVLEDGVLAEHFVSKTQQDSLIGNVYVGKVQNVLPSMEAAFIDIGRGRNAVLYAGEVNWDAANLDGQPRRIELALKSGDSVLVQVTKDPVGHKGARLTSQISLPGRYLVYVPGGSMTGISRKLPDVERNRLKKILKDRLPENAGVIVRTAAEGASEEELTHDINRLRAQWEEIERKANSTKTLAPELLYGEPDLTIKVVRDVFNEDFSKLIVSGEEAWDTIEAYVTYVAPDLVERLEKWTKDEDIFAASRIDEQISKALDRKVFLPSGGSLVIDRTEAMTVVDVNTGKFTGSGGNLEETVTKNNLEAAEEIVRQLRLRDIGGIIVIDFIDMVLESNRELVLRRLVECLGRDRTKHQVAEVTSLGLVQMTRKRMGTGLLEVFSEACETCAGRGVITHDEPVEHRHARAVASENREQHLRQEKQSRSERKRNRRGKEAQQPEAAAVAEEHKPDDDAARQARAQATRAALANIAAAAHAAHEAQEHAAHPEGAPAAPAASSAPDAGTGGKARLPEVLTIGGETVELPRGEHAMAAQREEPTLTLESLTAAFSRFPVEAEAGTAEPAAQREQAKTMEKAGEQAQVPPGRPGGQLPPASGTVRRPRKRRAASLAQGTADESRIERHESTVGGAAAADGGQTHTHAASLTQRKPAAEPAAEPTILGVGVPASEL